MQDAVRCMLYCFVLDYTCTACLYICLCANQTWGIAISRTYDVERKQQKGRSQRSGWEGFQLLERASIRNFVIQRLESTDCGLYIEPGHVELQCRGEGQEYFIIRLLDLIPRLISAEESVC